MKRLLGIFVVLAALALPAFCQYSRLSPDDQREFDKAYNKWVNDSRKNDRDDIARDVRRMQDIMARNNIPANVPYDQIASGNGNGYGSGYQDRGYRGQLSAQDQREFDKIYAKWVSDSRKNDRDDVEREERRMQDIMARNNIPANTPYDQVASMGNNGGYDNGYSNNGYGNNERGYSQNGNSQQRLSREDQQDFDHYYAQWVDDTQRNDRDDAARDAAHMQRIMMRYNIPSDVPFDQIASPGASREREDDRREGYRNDERGADDAYGQNRLSRQDQHDFDKAYAKWVNDSRKNDRDDVERDVRKMQDIMARYNIPSNVPYDQIASPDAGYRH